MTPAARNTAILAMALFLSACVSVGQIQQSAPVRTMKFSGSHKLVAQCVQQRLGGRVQDEAFGEKYIIYDAAKSRQADGFTHYAITVTNRGGNEGFAELRFKRPERGAGPGPRPPRLTAAVIREYWSPVQECAERAKAAS